jgi:hypothetical protein
MNPNDALLSRDGASANLQLRVLSLFSVEDSYLKLVPTTNYRAFFKIMPSHALY